MREAEQIELTYNAPREVGAVIRAGGAAPSDSLLEMTLTSGDFSTAAIPDSTFAIPKGYKKAN